MHAPLAGCDTRPQNWSTLAVKSCLHLPRYLQHFSVIPHYVQLLRYYYQQLSTLTRRSSLPSTYFVPKSKQACTFIGLRVLQATQLTSVRTAHRTSGCEVREPPREGWGVEALESRPLLISNFDFEVSVFLRRTPVGIGHTLVTVTVHQQTRDYIRESKLKVVPGSVVKV